MNERIACRTLQFANRRRGRGGVRCAGTRQGGQPVMLARLRSLLAKSGRLSGTLIDSERGMVTAQTYQRGFGSLLEAYRRIALSLLVARQPLHRILRARQAQEDHRQRRSWCAMRYRGTLVPPHLVRFQSATTMTGRFRSICRTFSLSDLRIWKTAEGRPL